MLTQYNTLTKCMFELKKSNLPVIVNLRLAVKLIQAKRILLDRQVEARIINVASSEDEFLDVYESVRHVCSDEGTVDEADLIILKLQDMIMDLIHSLECKCNTIYSMVTADESWIHGVLAKDRFLTL